MRTNLRMHSERWGESVAAIVAPRAGEAASGDEILAFCQGKLARYKQPKVVHFVDAIPRNPTGRTLRRVLRERFPGPAPE